MIFETPGSCGMIFKLKTFLKNTDGSALLLVLVIIMVLTTIIGAVLMGNFMQRRLFVKELQKIQARYLAEAAVYKTLWYLSGNGGRDVRWRPQKESIRLGEGQEARVSVTEWGGFLRVHATVILKNTINGRSREVGESVQALVGETLSPPFRQAIHIGGTSYPLVVTGKTRIVGDVMVGREGVKTGRIKGRGFQGPNVVDGRITRQSQPHMPPFRAGLLQKAFRQFRTALSSPSGPDVYEPLTIRAAEELDRDVLRNIFIHGDLQIMLDANDQFAGPYRFVSAGNITIRGDSRLLERIELIAAGKIFIVGQARIKDCILYAQEGIEISEHAQIEGQFFSPTEIIIKGDAVLEYPSLIYCSGKIENGSLRGLISLDDRSVLRGTSILAPLQPRENLHRNQMRLVVAKNAKIAGAVYTSSNTELHGVVIGSVVTNKFYLFVPPTTYLNWLRDATVDRTKLPGRFRLPIVFSEKPKLDIIKWE